MSTTEPALPSDLDALTALVGQGRRDAFSQIYGALAPQVYGIVRGVLGDPARSQEVAHDVLVEVWRTAARFDCSRGSTRAWVLTMAHRRAVDRVRSEQAAPDGELRIAGGAVEPPVAAEVDDLIDVKAVRDALGRLTALERQVIELAYFRGHTYQEVASLLGTPSSTVTTCIRNGLNGLRPDMTMTG